MRINLKDIPEQGQSWVFNGRTRDLADHLANLIGNAPFEAEIHLKPLSSGTFDLTGRLLASTPEACSRCGDDFRWVIKQSFHELLVPAMFQPRNSSFTRPNHISDLDPNALETTEYENGQFDVGEYFHELIALSVPLVPAPPLDDLDHCSHCRVKVERQLFCYDEPMERGPRPFDSLKQLRKN